ncbi:MAG: dipeptide epimerase [Acidobacteria bacterium]|nr:dipeptide epimerase [Acidobacteriota bacterium]MBI3425877.1 dipeptide epimerase [Acidobacteriota bacterium]
MNTRIVSLTVARHDFQLRNPSVVAYEALEAAPNIVVRLELENGLVGYGNAAPDQHVTGETAASVEHTITRLFKPVLLGADATRIEALWAQLTALAPTAPSAIAAVDIALYDLLGKLAGLPLYRLLGAARAAIETTVTLSIAVTATSVAQALAFQAQGFKALKIKIGLAADADVERVRAVRAAVGPAMRLTLDANQGYTLAETLRVLEALRACNIAFIEQPLDAADVEGMRELCARAPIPVMADESVLSAADVLLTPAPLINLKLMKTGGITGALKANAVAEARGIRTMIGCMDESCISLSAAAHLALALHNCAYADLDGHLDILDDVAKGGIFVTDGFVHVGAGAGLGISVIE